MRPRWMTDADYRILEFLVDTELTLTPKGVAYNTSDVTYYQVGNSIKRLQKYGLVRHPEWAPEGVKPDGVYEASPLGHRFMHHKLTFDELYDYFEKSSESR